MCTETPFSCARQRSLMCLAVLQLRHGRRSCDAAPELSAEEGSDPPFRDASIGIGEGWHVHAHATLRRGVAPSHGSLRTASGSSITHVMSVTYTFSDFARPPISSTVLNRLSRALRGRERMAIACAPVLPAPSAAFRAAIAGAPEAPVGRDPGGFGPFRGRGRPRGGSWRPSEPTSRRWVTHRTPGSSAELPSTFSFGGAEDRGSTAAQPTRPDPPATRGRPRA